MMWTAWRHKKKPHTEEKHDDPSIQAVKDARSSVESSEVRRVRAESLARRKERAAAMYRSQTRQDRLAEAIEVALRGGP